ncbi:hypothetical protein LB505_006978 [Fusarium chuoi]|nr:hypothetical protein LB505_006978 [Fusarium chuoi]
MPILLGPYTSPQEDAFPSEIPYGRAGALYMLRMVKHWVPRSESLVESPIKRLTERIMATDDDGRGNWEWHGKSSFFQTHRSHHNLHDAWKGYLSFKDLTGIGRLACGASRRAKAQVSFSGAMVPLASCIR